MSEFTSKYNEQDFIIEINIKYKDEIVVPIQRGDLNSIKISKNLNSHFIGGVVNFKDTGNLYIMNITPDSNWTISFKIVQSSFGENLADSGIILEDDYTFEYEFLITNFNPISSSAEFTSAEISFIDPQIQAFLKPVAFSSHYLSQDITKIITQLLVAAGFDSSEIDTIEESEIMDKFITDNNSMLYDQMEFLLNKLYSKEKGFLFYYYDWVDEKLKFIWSTNVLTDDTEISEDSYNWIPIPSPELTKRNEGTAISYIFYNNQDYQKDVHLFQNTYIQDFNLEKSVVEITEDNKFDTEFFKELFDINDTDNVVLYPEDILSIDKVGLSELTPGQYYNKSNEDVFYKKLRKAFIKNGLIQVKCQGMIWRKIGEKYYIDYQQIGTDAKLNGYWFCVGIEDVFANNNYYQFIYLTRSSYEMDFDEFKTSLEGE